MTIPCPDCGRPMTYGGAARNRMVCVPCETPKHWEFGRQVIPEESITDLKLAGKCYCHLMDGRKCAICRGKK